MCRWLAYTCNPILLEEILFTATRSLIDQSMCSKSVETPTNGDGFGIGWYGSRPQPGLFRRINPALRDRLAPTTRVVVSGPIGAHAETWLPVEQGASLTIRKGEVVARPFAPISPT